MTKLSIAVTSVALFGSIAIAFAQSPSACNPEMPRYPEWQAAQHFPATLNAKQTEALAAKVKLLQIGFTKDQVRAQAGAPDYVADGSSTKNGVACMWIYSFSDAGPNTNPGEKRVVVAGFTSDGKLALLYPQHVVGISRLALKDKSCETLPSDDHSVIESVGAGKTYVASQGRQAHIRAGYTKVSSGMSIAQVESLLGTPDIASAMPKGHAGNALIVGEPCKQQLTYILRQASDNPIDPDTAAIYLTFDEQGRLYWAAPQNVEDLKQIGSPVQ